MFSFGRQEKEDLLYEERDAGQPDLATRFLQGVVRFWKYQLLVGLVWGCALGLMVVWVEQSPGPAGPTTVEGQEPSFMMGFFGGSLIGALIGGATWLNGLPLRRKDRGWRDIQLASLTLLLAACLAIPMSSLREPLHWLIWVIFGLGILSFGALFQAQSRFPLKGPIFVGTVAWLAWMAGIFALAAQHHAGHGNAMFHEMQTTLKYMIIGSMMWWAVPIAVCWGEGKNQPTQAA